MDSFLRCVRLVWQILQSGWSEDLTFPGYHWARADEAMLAAWGIGALGIVALVFRRIRRGPGRSHVVIPSLVPLGDPSPYRLLRHVPLVLVLLGLLAFLLALADPLRSFVREEASVRGRRIALLVDASGSMGRRFEAPRLKTKQNVEFYTAVSAAEHFVRLRMAARHHDLISLVEFAKQAYVITPFTDDYDTILMSLSLIGEPEEWMRFPESGTVMISAISQGVALFKLFGFLQATGNIMVMFSDAQDTQVIFEGRPLESILAEAREHHVPIYLIRTGYGKGMSAEPGTADPIWAQAVRETGGRFYAAASEDVILQALGEIDRAATGNIVRTRYGSRTPHFTPFMLLAVLCWSAALGARLSWRYFRQFP